MESNSNGESFSYTYSAKQQEEVKNIRERYTPAKENKMEQLRKLDQSVKQSGVIPSLTVGIIGSLIMGFGMACVMEFDIIILGLIFGLIGMIGMIIAYPFYKSTTEKKRKELMPKIIELSDELMQGQ